MQIEISDKSAGTIWNDVCDYDHILDLVCEVGGFGCMRRIFVSSGLIVIARKRQLTQRIAPAKVVSSAGCLKYSDEIVVAVGIHLDDTESCKYIYEIFAQTYHFSLRCAMNLIKSTSSQPANVMDLSCLSFIRP